MRRLTWAAVIIVCLILGFIIGAIVGLNSLQGVAFVLAGLAFGMILGFFLDWLLEEAYRRNRELSEKLQLAQRQSEPKQLPPPQAQIAEAETVLDAERIAVLEPDQTEQIQPLVDILQQKEDELKVLRAELDDVDTKGRAINERFITYMKSHPDDLTVIKGIGAVYQWKLRDVGVHSYHDLAEANADHLRRILDIKNWQRTDIESWIKQARDWAAKD